MRTTELAAAIGVTDTAVRRYEAGQEPRGITTAVRIARVLGLALEDLVEIIEE